MKFKNVAKATAICIRDLILSMYITLMLIIIVFGIVEIIAQIGNFFYFIVTGEYGLAGARAATMLALLGVAVAAVIGSSIYSEAARQDLIDTLQNHEDPDWPE